MKAVVFADTRSVMVDEVSDSVVEKPTDVVVRVTSSAICGTDLHMYDGRTGATAGLVLGHEPLGVLEQAGSVVELVKPGDRVVIPTHLYCGVCVNCARGYSAACLRLRLGGSAPPTATRGWAPTVERKLNCATTSRSPQPSPLRAPWIARRHTSRPTSAVI
jgi:glutathione-independent formaldehyde dehydrogenase